MASEIEFTNNYTDLSTNNGFQYEFTCNRCGSGYRTRFDAWSLGTASQALEGASSLFGGILGRAADAAERARSAAWEKAHDKAFESAAKEVVPKFAQCPHCSSWVCRDHCWNKKRGLCKQCAPDLGVEMTAAQMSKSVEEIRAHAKMAEDDLHLAESDWREGVIASCPACGAPQATNAKFCPECGASLKAAKHCSQCGTKLQPNAKFCPECGAKGS